MFAYLESEITWESANATQLRLGRPKREISTSDFTEVIMVGTWKPGGY